MTWSACNESGCNVLKLVSSHHCNQRRPCLSIAGTLYILLFLLLTFQAFCSMISAWFVYQKVSQHRQGAVLAGWGKRKKCHETHQKSTDNQTAGELIVETKQKLSPHTEHYILTFIRWAFTIITQNLQGEEQKNSWLQCVQNVSPSLFLLLHFPVYL